MNWRVVGIWAAQAVGAGLVSLVAGRVGGVIAQALIVIVLVGVVAARPLAKIPEVLVLLAGWAAISPVTVAGSVLVWLVPALLRKSGWAGATLAAATLPLGVWLVMHPGWVVVTMAAIAAGIVVWTQRDQWKAWGV